VKLLRMTLRTALRALRRNMLRSALTILGIVIGVAAVITTVGIGQGASRAIQDQIRGLGNNLVIVVPGTRRAGGAHSGWGGAATLTIQDARAIEREVVSIDGVAPMRVGPVQVVYGNANWATTAQATTPSFRYVTDTDVSSGEFFTERDLKSGARVVLLGQTIVSGGIDPLLLAEHVCELERCVP
jgi:putative ABC transport system permease protein